MNDAQPGAITDREGDLEYDLAHETSGLQKPVEREHDDHQAAVATTTPAYAGDYSYDLAHDMPDR